MATLTALGTGQTVVQVVAETSDDSRAYVVDEDGLILPTKGPVMVEALPLDFGKGARLLNHCLE